MSYRLCKTAGIVVMLWFACSMGAFGATKIVDASVVGGFSPQVVNIFTGDTVEWVAINSTDSISITGPGIGSSSVTTNANGTTNVANSTTIGGLNNPKTFSFQFTNAGSFGYTDTFNPFLVDHSGTVNVAASPPTVTIGSPANGSVFAPSVPILFSATNSTAVNTRFLVNGTNFIGFQTGSNVAITFFETNVGEYVLTIVVTNTGGLVSTSAPVDIFIAQPVTMVSPTNGQTFYTNTPITFSVEATNFSPLPLGVGYLVNAAPITNRVDAQFDVTNFNELVTGTYTVAAVVTNSIGFATTSAPVTIFIAEPFSLASPTPNSVFLANTSIPLIPNLSTVSLLPESVTFAVGTVLYSNVTSFPFSVNFSTNVAGNYFVQALLTNSAGIASTSPIVNIEVLGASYKPGIISPTPSASYQVNSVIPLTPDFSGASFLPTNVDFVIGTGVYKTLTAPPFTVNFSTNVATNYTFEVVATYVGGLKLTSAAVNFAVSPFQYTPSIPTGSGLVISNGTFGFAFNASGSGSYAIQMSTDLGSTTNWVTVTNIPSGGTATFSTPVTNSSAFFRWLFTTNSP